MTKTMPNCLYSYGSPVFLSQLFEVAMLLFGVEPFGNTRSGGLRGFASFWAAESVDEKLPQLLDDLAFVLPLTSALL